MIHRRVSVDQPTLRPPQMLRPPQIDAAEPKERFAASLMAIGEFADR